MRKNWVIIADRNGQLGNRLIVFSHFIANAMEKGYGVVNPFFSEYDTYFDWFDQKNGPPAPYHSRIFRSRLLNKLSAVVISKTAGLLIRIAKESPWHKVLRIYQTFDRQNTPDGYLDLQGSEFEAALQKKYILVQGWKFRSYTAVEKYGDTIRSVFRLKTAYAVRVYNHLQRMRKTHDLVVGVHIRRGDYQYFENGKYYFSIDEYSAMMSKLYHGMFSGKKICFMVCSNDPIATSAFNGLPVESGPGHFIEDMYALAGCDYIIGPPSTFSHWAAFYGKKPLARLTSPTMNIQPDDFRIPITL